MLHAVTYITVKMKILYDCLSYRKMTVLFHFTQLTHKKVQVGKDKETTQSEKDSHSKNRGGKNKLTIRYLYHENI